MDDVDKTEAMIKLYNVIEEPLEKGFTEDDIRKMVESVQR